MKKGKTPEIRGSCRDHKHQHVWKDSVLKERPKSLYSLLFLISHKSRSFCSAATKHLCADVSTVGNILIQRWSHGHVVAPPSLVKTWASQYIYVTCLYLPLIIPKRFLVARALGLLLHFYINPSSRKKKHAFSLLT